MGAYSVVAVAAAFAVVVAEVAWLRTGLLGTRAYWIAITIVVAFQVAVDGWLTKLSAPVVVYNAHHFSGIRLPWDIPIEDFAYGWALVTLTMLLWERAGGAERRRRASARPGPRRGS